MEWRVVMIVDMVEVVRVRRRSVRRRCLQRVREHTRSDFARVNKILCEEEKCI